MNRPTCISCTLKINYHILSYLCKSLWSGSNRAEVTVISVALQPRRSKTDRRDCRQVAVQGPCGKKVLSLNINFIFLNGFQKFSYQVATRMYSRGWVDPVPQTFLGQSRESNPGPLRWQSDANHYTQQVIVTVIHGFKKLRLQRFRYDRGGKNKHVFYLTKIWLMHRFAARWS